MIVNPDAGGREAGCLQVMDFTGQKPGVYCE
jgi:hypothetical protein